MLLNQLRIDKPTVVSDAINNNPAIEFDGSEDGLYSPSNLNGITDEFSFFFIVDKASTNNNRTILSYQRNNYGMMHTYGESSGNYSYSIYTNSDWYWNKDGNHPIMTGAQMLSSTWKASDQLEYFANGAPKGVQTHTNNLTTTPSGSRLLIGSGSSNGTTNYNRLFDGKIGEVIVYNRQLSDTERRRVESYLAIKYGLTIDQSTPQNYITANGTTIYDATGSLNGYLNDIAGIGLDKSSGLYQKKSKSINDDAIVTVEKTGGISTDNSFIIWGNDNGSLGTTNINSPASYDKLNRTWKTDVTGTPGNVNLSFELTSPIVNSGQASDYALLIDTDTDFSNATAHTTGASLSGNTITFTNVNLPDNATFTLGTKISTESPGGISNGLSVWLKADNGVTGTTSVSQWDNSYTSGDFYSQSNSPERPSVVNNGINFNKAILWGGDDRMQRNSDINLPEGIVYAVINAEDYTSRTTLLEKPSGSNRTALRYEQYYNKAQIGFTRFGVSDYTSSVTTPFDESSIISFEKNPTSNNIDIQSILNGVNNSDALNVGTTNTTLPTRQLGRYLKGKIGELIIYESVPTALEKQRIESYLALKYGIHKQGSYISSDGVTTWDPTGGYANFNHLVAGVGRDDNSALDQRKSRNENSLAVVTIEKTSSFGTDGAYLMWGHNNLETSFNNSDAPTGYYRPNKLWKVKSTGTPGNVDVKLILAGGMINTGDASDYALLIDGDLTFSNASVFTSGATLVGDTISFTNVSFNDGDHFTIGSKVITAAPGGIADNLQSWFKADAGVTESSGSVSAWTDNSPLVASATQSNVSRQPTLTNDAINSNPALSFDGGNDIMLTPDALPGLTDEFSFFFVLDKNTTHKYKAIASYQKSNWGLLHSYGEASGNNNYTIYGSTTGWGWNKDGTHPVVTGAQIIGSTWHKNNGIKYFANGNPRGSHAYTSSITHTPTNSRLTIGGRGNNGSATSYSQYFDGNIAEVIVYGKELSGTAKEKVESYLGIKYGIPLGHNYVAFDGTTLWDYSAEPIFNHLITGIGASGANGLNQTKSKCQFPGAMLTVEAQSALDDEEYLLWGHNNGGTNFGNNVPGTMTFNLGRIWKTSEVGETGDLTLSFDLTGVLDMPTQASEIVLVVDNDSIFNDGTTYNATSLVGNTLTFSNINLANDQYFTISTWKAIVWNGSAFENGSGPGNSPDMTDGIRKLFVNGPGAVLTENAEVQSIEVATGADITVNSGKSLTVTNAILNDGSITVENNGSLIQSHTGANENSGSGSYHIKRTGGSSDMMHDSWGSPVQTHSILGSGGVFDGANPCDVYTFMADIQEWRYDYPLNYSTTCLSNPVVFGSSFVMTGGDGIMDVARGYFVPGATSNTKQFDGEVNNGDISVAVELGPNPGANWTGDNWNLVSNPYPSAINASDFVTANAGVITSNLYFWDQLATGGGSESDYVVWNSAGTVNNNAGSAQSFGNIGSGQGFFVEAIANGNLNFSNSMRNGNNDTFFKRSNTDKERIWISAHNPLGRNVQQLIAFVDDATDGHDNKYDAKYLEGDASHNFYSILDQEKMVIQGLPIPFDLETTTIPLGIDCDAPGKYRFSLDKTDNISGDVFFWDSLNLVTYNLKQEIPEILLDSGSYMNRFYLKYSKIESQNDTTTSVSQVNDFIDPVQFINGDEEYTIETTDQKTIGKVEIFDLLGRTWYNKEHKTTSVKISKIKQKNLFIRITRNNGDIITKRIVF